MTSATHLRYEVLRTVRNRRFFAVTLALPLVLFYAIASANRHVSTDGISFPLYFMTGMAAYGAMFAASHREGASRPTGQELDPADADHATAGPTYFAAKVVTAYLVALPTLILLGLAGASLGVRLPAAQWLEMAGLLLAGLAPFIVMGIIVAIW